MELVKESNTANLFENESLSQSVHLQQLLGLAPPVTSSITPNLNDLSKSLLSIFNNTSSPAAPLLFSPKSASHFGARQSDTPKNCLNTSNDDSLDSQSASCNGDEATGKSQNTRYRRRKPQKTVRLSSELNATDSGSATQDNEKDHVTKNEPHKSDPINSNGINFPPFHSDANCILSQPNAAGVLPPQTQSIDLSHHCASQEIFKNGLVNYSKPTNLELANASVGGERSDKPTNLLPNDEMNNLNLFGAVNFSHLRGTNLTNDIATFPNTDDLVKKVEELVKCNEQNGFSSNEFEPMELTKPNANKLVSDAYENNRLSNGISDAMKISNTIDHMNNHSGAIKCNGNGIVPAIQPNPNDTNENKTQEIDRSIASEVKISNGTPPPMPSSSENGEFKVNSPKIDADKMMNNHNDVLQSSDKQVLTEFSAGISSVDGYGPVNGKPLNEVTTNQSNFNSNFASAQQHFTANTQNENHTSSYNNNSNDLTKEATSASSSESRSNPSPTPKKKATSKKKATNRCNVKMTKPNPVKSNQKNPKSKDKTDKAKSDIKKTKSKDESSASEALSKFRGPYVHVEKDGTLEVINAPLNEEIAEKQSKFKKNYISQRPADRNRIRGLHVSTLSNKYDAVTTDISWMCVFCKLGPHKYGLGDLFGPFILSTESEDFQLAQIDPKEDIFKSIRNKANMAYPQNMSSATAAKSISKSGSTGNVRHHKEFIFSLIHTKLQKLMKTKMWLFIFFFFAHFAGGGEEKTKTQSNRQ